MVPSQESPNEREPEVWALERVLPNAREPINIIDIGQDIMDLAQQINTIFAKWLAYLSGFSDLDTDTKTMPPHDMQDEEPAYETH